MKGCNKALPVLFDEHVLADELPWRCMAPTHSLVPGVSERGVPAAEEDEM